ncbi:hypothetical protein [Streptomyces violaceusniger]|uniref:hypothetical protein n=1 Tax=Streptomyces violaceusniger TaxID=68280 RepID=UPI00381B9C57
MPSQHKNPVRGLRGIDQNLWDDFEAATAEADTDRSAELRRYMEWYVRRPDARQPTRPPEGPWSDPQQP